MAVRKTNPGMLNLIRVVMDIDRKPDDGSNKTSTNKSQPSAEGQTGDRIFKNTFGTLIFAHKWQKAMSEEKKGRLIELFTNPRDDPFDVYKPNSSIETQVTCELPFNRPLPDMESGLIHEIAANYDYCVPLDIIESYKPRAFVSHESKEQLDRLPTWLRFILVLKFDTIHERYGHHTHHFIKLLANRIDSKRSVNVDTEVVQEDGDDAADALEIQKRFGLNEIDLTNDLQRRQEELYYNDLFRLKYAIWKWKLPKTLEQDWAPTVIHRAATTLRKAMLNNPTAAELAMVAEDERIARTAIEYVDVDDEEEDEDIYKKPHWEDMVTDKVAFKEEVAMLVEEDLKRIPSGLTKKNQEEEERLAKEREMRVNQKVLEKKKKISWWMRIWNHKMIKDRREKSERKNRLAERATYRRYSKIWYKNCPMEPIKQAKRLPHHYRIDESFHAYVVALVGSMLFKFFVMFVIIANALLLALETNETRETYWISYTFEILDNLFLSVYLVEFLLKVYAHPYRYWMSGFNVFDFIILIVSLVKAVLDWTGYAEVSYLKVLVIVRALRVLRGISLSVQIQVLITALVETLKTHVLSVLVLLFLLMYITSIIAFYLFSEIPGLEHPWKHIILGMLYLFSFVTMDGWTDINDTFTEAGYIHQGRFFCLICILMGNFLISNIFIAIIIMQISEATEAFRTRQRDEREEIIGRKKEVVFRRQKLDMRQLLAKQNLTINADFYYLGSQFLRLLRHDDLVDMNDVPFSPLWMDCFYKAIHRCHHTANLLMNLHRQLADNFLEVYRKTTESQYTITPIRRGRYNRCMKLKSKLSLLRQEFYRQSPDKKINRPLRLRYEPKDSADSAKRNAPVNSAQTATGTNNLDAKGQNIQANTQQVTKANPQTKSKLSK